MCLQAAVGPSRKIDTIQCNISNALKWSGIFLSISQNSRNKYTIGIIDDIKEANDEMVADFNRESANHSGLALPYFDGNLTYLAKSRSMSVVILSRFSV